MNYLPLDLYACNMCLCVLLSISVSQSNCLFLLVSLAGYIFLCICVRWLVFIFGLAYVGLRSLWMYLTRVDDLFTHHQPLQPLISAPPTAAIAYIIPIP